MDAFSDPKFSLLQIVLLLRLVPLLPFNMLNYLLSVTPVSLGEYMLASWLGMMVLSLSCFYNINSDLVYFRSQIWHNLYVHALLQNLFNFSPIFSCLSICSP